LSAFGCPGAKIQLGNRIEVPVIDLQGPAVKWGFINLTTGQGEIA
jgi:hypothetical protein